MVSDKITFFFHDKNISYAASYHFQVERVRKFILSSAVGNVKIYCIREGVYQEIFLSRRADFWQNVWEIPKIDQGYECERNFI